MSHPVVLTTVFSQNKQNPPISVAGDMSTTLRLLAGMLDVL